MEALVGKTIIYNDIPYEYYETATIESINELSGGVIEVELWHKTICQRPDCNCVGSWDEGEMFIRMYKSEIENKNECEILNIIYNKLVYGWDDIAIRFYDVKNIISEYCNDVVIESAQENVDIKYADYFFICIPYLSKIEPFIDEIIEQFENMGYDVSWCPEPETHGYYDAVLNLL
jgi:hypothetical protein